MTATADFIVVGGIIPSFTLFFIISYANTILRRYCWSPSGFTPCTYRQQAQRPRSRSWRWPLITILSQPLRAVYAGLHQSRIGSWVFDYPTGRAWRKNTSVHEGERAGWQLFDQFPEYVLLRCHIIYERLLTSKISLLVWKQGGLQLLGWVSWWWHLEVGEYEEETKWGPPLLYTVRIWNSLIFIRLVGDIPRRCRARESEFRESEWK